MEHIGDGRQRLHADPALMERVAHLSERDPGFALRNLSQCVRMWLEDHPTIATNLRRSCASRLANTLQKLDRGRRAPSLPTAPTHINHIPPIPCKPEPL